MVGDNMPNPWRVPSAYADQQVRNPLLDFLSQSQRYAPVTDWSVPPPNSKPGTVVKYLSGGPAKPFRVTIDPDTGKWDYYMSWDEMQDTTAGNRALTPGSYPAEDWKDVSFDQLKEFYRNQARENARYFSNRGMNEQGNFADQHLRNWGDLEEWYARQGKTLGPSPLTSTPATPEIPTVETMPATSPSYTPPAPQIQPSQIDPFGAGIPQILRSRGVPANASPSLSNVQTVPQTPQPVAAAQQYSPPFNADARWDALQDIRDSFPARSPTALKAAAAFDSDRMAAYQAAIKAIAEAGLSPTSRAADAARREAWGGQVPWNLEDKQYFPTGAAASRAREMEAIEARIKAEGIDPNSFEAERIRQAVGTAPINMVSIKTIRGPSDIEGAVGMTYLRDPNQVADAEARKQDFDTWLKDKLMGREAGYAAMAKAVGTREELGDASGADTLLDTLMGNRPSTTPTKPSQKQIGDARESIKEQTIAYDPMTSTGITKGNVLINKIDLAARTKQPWELMDVASTITDMLDQGVIADLMHAKLRMAMDILKPALGNLDGISQFPELDILRDFWTKSTKELEIMIPKKRSTNTFPTPFSRAWDRSRNDIFTNMPAM